MKKIVALFLAVIMLLSSAALAEGMTAGTYQASAQGYHGSIVLKVTVDADKMGYRAGDEGKQGAVSDYGSGWF